MEELSNRGHHPASKDDLDMLEDMLQFWTTSAANLEIRARALTILLHLPLSQKKRNEVLTRSLNAPESEMQLATIHNCLFLGGEYRSKILGKLKQLLSVTTTNSSIRFACAECIIQSDDYKEEEIMFLLKVISMQAPDTIEGQNSNKLLIDLLRLLAKAKTNENFSAILKEFIGLVISISDEKFEDFENAILFQSDVFTIDFEVDLHEAFSKLLNSNDTRITVRAIKLWGLFPLKSLLSITPQIVHMLRCDSEKIKLAIIENLSQSDFGHSEVIKEVLYALRNDKSNIKVAMLQTLKGNIINTVEIADILIEMLKGNDPKIADAAALVEPH